MGGVVARAVLEERAVFHRAAFFLVLMAEGQDRVPGVSVHMWLRTHPYCIYYKKIHDEESYGVFKTDNVQTATAVPIDETIDLQPTLIKMDIEGAEPNALQGTSVVLAGGQSDTIRS